MTPDVDGSLHSYACCLDLFFRQNAVLIETWLYAYNCQTSLCTSQKGKQEQYLKDDDALEEYLRNRRWKIHHCL